MAKTPPRQVSRGTVRGGGTTPKTPPPKADQTAKALPKPPVRRRNKYGAIKTPYGGHVYDSKREAVHARLLDMQVAVGEVTAWKRQVRIPLKVNGKLVCTHIVDFEVTYPDGRVEWQEVKGVEHRVWLLKKKLIEALYPDRIYRVIR